MRLIADSGSTKTDWRLISNTNQIQQFKTEGINPNYQSTDEIDTIIDQLEVKGKPDEIYFYGAGCSAEISKNRIIQSLERRFKDSTISIYSDLLGSCRSLSGNSAGIVCILGTGSNACFYNGTEIIRGAPSFGYVLGDEGSGNWLGRKLLHDYYGKKMDAKSRISFEQTFKDSLNDVLRNIYLEPRPAAYLASFAKIIGQHINQPYFYTLVYNAFIKFIENNILYFQEGCKVPVHFTGSIAYYFSNILRKSGVDSGITIKNVVESPIAGLTLYHQYS